MSGCSVLNVLGGLSYDRFEFSSESLTHGLSGCFAFRVLKGVGEFIELAICHSKCLAPVAPAGDRAIDLAQYISLALASGMRK